MSENHVRSSSKPGESIVSGNLSGNHESVRDGGNTNRLQSLTHSTAGKVGICLASLLAAQGRADAHTPETDPNHIATRVYVASGPQSAQVDVPEGNSTSLAVNRDDALSVVWMSKKFSCDGQTPANAADFKVPTSAQLSCYTEQTPGVMQGVTAVTARVPAPMQNGQYSFDVNDCNDCARDISVTVKAPVLTEDTGYARQELDQKLSEIGDNETCCELSGGVLLQPDINSSTATPGVGANLLFQARPHENFGVGLQYSYSVADVWLNPEFQRSEWTDNTHPEHLHQIHARGVFTLPLIRGDHDWLRLEAGALFGTSIWHYEGMPYDQYTGQLDENTYSWQVQSAQNQTHMTFDVGGTAGVSFYPHKHIVLQVGADGLVNVNGHDRMRSSNTDERIEPENDDRDFRLGLRGNLGVAF